MPNIKFEVEEPHYVPYNVLGIDDGGFQLFNFRWAYVDVFGVIMRGKEFTEDVLKTSILIDDPDPTTKIISMVEESNKQIHAILHQGITIGGFGILDADRIVERLGIPFVVMILFSPNNS